ncbi:MAG: hypothetical protein ACRD1B_05015 [Thermoanaerobaculia bacterium]
MQLPREPSSQTGRARLISALIVVLALLILLRAAPIARAYALTFRKGHTQHAGVLLGLALAAVVGLLFLGILRWPRATCLGVGLLAILLAVASGNAVALLVTATLIGFTALVGDGVSRLFRGREAQEEDVLASFAAGCVSLGGVLLALGELGLAKTVFLPAAAIVLVVARRRRIPALIGALGRSFHPPRSGSPSAVEAAWLTVLALVLVSGFVGALRPDVSWDGIAYHLPQVRGFAEAGRVEPLPTVYPLSFLWQNYETYLALGFLCGGEPVVRLLHFAVGLGAFAAAFALSQRVASRGSGILVLLALAAFPAACVQLKETYVDLPAAFFLTAAAAQLAASDREPGRARLGAFLFGGAVATKVFALFGIGALAVLMLRRGKWNGRRILSLALCALVPLLPWWAWSQSRTGFFLAPYSDAVISSNTNLIEQPFVLLGPRPTSASSWAIGFLRLPYDLTFYAARFWTGGDGYTGLLPLLLLVGLFAWDRRRLLLFCGAALVVLVPWYALSNLELFSPSIRFLIPVYALYAVFAAQGLDRLTEGFRGGAGKAAAFSLAALSIAFPAQLFSVAFDAKVAIGLVSREEALAAYLPAYPLWKHVRREDRVIILGDWDRYHCPAAFVFWDRYLPTLWGDDPHRWRREMRQLRISCILYRSDQRDRSALLQSLGDCLRPVESRGPATLYRVELGLE